MCRRRLRGGALTNLRAYENSHPGAWSEEILLLRRPVAGPTRTSAIWRGRPCRSPARDNLESFRSWSSMESIEFAGPKKNALISHTPGLRAPGPALPGRHHPLIFCSRENALPTTDTQITPPPPIIARIAFGRPMSRNQQGERVPVKKFLAKPYHLLFQSSLSTPRGFSPGQRQNVTETKKKKRPPSSGDAGFVSQRPSNQTI